MRCSTLELFVFMGYRFLRRSLLDIENAGIKCQATSGENVGGERTLCMRRLRPIDFGLATVRSSDFRWFCEHVEESRTSSL